MRHKARLWMLVQVAYFHGTEKKAFHKVMRIGKALDIHLHADRMRRMKQAPLSDEPGALPRPRPIYDIVYVPFPAATFPATAVVAGMRRANREIVGRPKPYGGLIGLADLRWNRYQPNRD